MVLCVGTYATPATVCHATPVTVCPPALRLVHTNVIMVLRGSWVHHTARTVWWWLPAVPTPAPGTHACTRSNPVCRGVLPFATRYAAQCHVRSGFGATHGSGGLWCPLNKARKHVHTPQHDEDSGVAKVGLPTGTFCTGAKNVLTFPPIDIINHILRYLYAKPPCNNRKCGLNATVVLQRWVFQRGAH